MAISLDLGAAIVATQQRMTLEEYLTYDDGTGVRYELVDGVLVAMGAESTLNNWIALFLIEIFLQQVERQQIGIKQTIEVPSRYATARDVDLIIHSPESAMALEGLSSACLKWGEPSPFLVIEVVSPGPESSENYQRDYVQKPGEYAGRGIPEYWIIDPDRAWIKVGILVDGAYEFVTFVGGEAIASKTFPALQLTASQVLSAGRS